MAGPFYFAWVDSTDKTFGVSHHVMDENIFSARRIVAEGEKPLLEIEIHNPHIGILSSGRKYWAWFSWFNGTSIVPLFFGRVVGTPVQIFDEVIRIQLVAEPIDYHQRVQLVAEGLKYAPFYDEVFIDVGKRDDPDTILEAHAKVWDVNPITLAVTANDIIVGADGNVDLTEDDHFYDSMNMTVSQPPATAILMDASVSWTQSGRGIVDLGNKTIFSYSGDGIISEWPKPLQSLGAGWSVYYSNAVDANGVANALTGNYSYSWRNTDKTHVNGDTMSYSRSETVPMVKSAVSGLLTENIQPGFVDAFAVDGDGDPAPVNRPASYANTKAYVPLWQVNTSLVLQYVAERQRTERVVFVVRADLQPVLVDPTVSQESETMTRSGANVGVPIINLLNWTTIAGTAISVGQVIFPDNPSVPGAQSAQICTSGGTAGLVEPTFSDIPGTPTTDGTVTWSSLGSATPTDNAAQWTFGSNVPLGTVILPSRPFYVSWTTLEQPGRAQFPPAGVTVSPGQVIQSSNGSFQVCTLSGITGTTEPGFSGTWGTVTADGSAEWTSLGMALPSGTSYFIATTGGVTGAEYVFPPFNETLHATTSDNSVVWTCIGTGSIPMGGVPGDVGGVSYFASARGQVSIEYLGSLVRAKLLYRARCIEITFDCEYRLGVDLTTRKTVTLHDPRIAGGVALGKIKHVELSVDGGGAAIAHVTLACCAGLGTSISTVTGTPTYVATGYMDVGYQLYSGVTTVLPSSTNLGYAPPVYTSNDDGLSFPLDYSQVVVVDAVHGAYGNQVGPINSAIASMAQAARITQQTTTSLTQSVSNQTQAALANANSVQHQLGLNPVWQEYQIKPVNAGPFHKVYNVLFTHLTVPMGVDLQSNTDTST